MIIIHNISKEHSSTGWQRYEVKVNEELICEFDHKASNGLAECLRAAGDAVEDKMNIDMEGTEDIKADLKVRNKQIYENRVFDKMTLKGIGKKYGLTKERVRQIVYEIGCQRVQNMRSGIKDGEFPDSFLLENIDLSVRVQTCMRCSGIKTVGEVKKMSVNDLFRIKNFGRKSFRELREVIWGENPVLW